MKHILLAVACGFAIVSYAEQPLMREWRSAKGSTFKGTFVGINKQDSTRVDLMAETGKQVSPKIEDLSTEDRAYIEEATYVPKEITTTFRRKSGFSHMLEEVGVSPAATLGDTNVLNLVDDKGTLSDSRWVILSVDKLGNRLLPVKQAGFCDEMTTEGIFVFVLFWVEKNGNSSSTPAAPRLIDSRNRKLPMSRHYEVLRHFIPAGTRLAGYDDIPVGVPCRCCAIYEMGSDVDPVAVEIFPVALNAYSITDETNGKQIRVSTRTAVKEGTKAVANIGVPNAPPSEADIIISGFPMFKSKTEGKTAKVRHLEGTINLRTKTNQSQTVMVKAFFIASPQDSMQELVFDTKQAEVTVEPGRLNPVSLRSDDVPEYHGYYFNNNTRTPGITLKGEIIQIWSEGKMLLSWTSATQWQRFKDQVDVIKEMGQLKRSLYE